MKWVDISSTAVLATAPTVEPVTYEFVSGHPSLRLASEDDRPYVEDLIKVARRKVEQDTGRVLMTQSWDVICDLWPEDALILPIEPVQSVTSITLTSPAGAASVWAASNYQVDVASAPPRIYLADAGSWPGDVRLHKGIAVRFVAGYGSTPETVPADLREAVIQVVAALYASRSNPNFLLPPKWFGYDALIAPYRIVGIG